MEEVGAWMDIHKSIELDSCTYLRQEKQPNSWYSHFHLLFWKYPRKYEAEVEVEISGKGSSRKHSRQSNQVCFQLFVNIYVLKTYSF